MKKLAKVSAILFITLVSIASDSVFACLAGGEGATSCTHSSTIGPVTVSSSVSCGDGYYACCNSSTASCKKNPPAHEE